MNPYLVTLYTLAIILLTVGGFVLLSNQGYGADLARAALGGAFINGGFLTLIAGFVAGAVVWKKPAAAQITDEG